MSRSTEGDSPAPFAFDYVSRRREPLDTNTRISLSRAHILPQRLGGTVYTLACKECNNRIGSDVEAYEVQRAEVNRSLRGESGKPLTVSLVAHDSRGVAAKVRAEMTIRKDSATTFRIVPGASDPNEVGRLFQLMKTWGDTDGAAQGYINIDFREKMGWDRGRLTYLHAAFMYLFHQFGYEWALDACVEQIRRQLTHPSDHVLPLRIPIIGEQTDVKIPTDKMSVGVISRPETLQGFLVTIPRLAHMPEAISIWMPLFGREYPLEAGEDLVHGDIKFAPLPEMHRYLTDPRFKGMGHYLVERCLQTKVD